MKKRILIFLVLIVFTMCTGIVSVNANANTKKIDVNGPSCTININKKVKLGKTIDGFISCYDDSDLESVVISPSDFNIRSKFLGKIKVTNVSEGYRSNNNPRYYIWNFTIKGVFLGNVNFQLKPGVISDTFENKNISSTTAVVKVTF